MLTLLCTVLMPSSAGPRAIAQSGPKAGAAAQRPTQPHPSKLSKVTPGPLPLFPVRTLWTLALNNALTAPPAYEGNHAYFPIEGDRIVAYDLASGRQCWIVRAATTLAPAASAELLFVAGSGTISALRVTDGSLAWSLPFPDTLAVPPVFDNGWLVLSAIEGSLSVLRAADGASIWHRPLGSAAHAPPTLAADHVYVPTEDGRVVALRIDSGAILWEYRLGGAANDLLALEDRLYVGSADDFLYCLKTLDGTQAWRVRTGADVLGLPVVDERTVYFVSLDNVLRALNRGSGNQRWKRALPLRPTGGPVKAAQTLLIGAIANVGQKVPGYKMENGSPDGDLSPGGEIAAAPYVFEPLVGAPHGGPKQEGREAGDPVVIIITRDVVKGEDTVTAFAHSNEPALAPSVPVLPNAVPIIGSQPGGPAAPTRIPGR